MRLTINLLFLSLSVFLVTSCGSNSNNTKEAKTDTSTVSATPSSSLKDQLPGTWIQQESGAAKIKMVFTNDEAIKYDNDQKEDTYKYKWLNDDQVEMEVKGVKVTSNITIINNELIMDIQGMGAIKYKRDTSSTSTGISQPSGDQSPSRLLVGTWRMLQNRKTISLEFKADGNYSRTEITTYEDPQFGPDKSSISYSYRVTNENTVEIVGAGQTASFELVDNGNTLKWKIDGKTEYYNRL